MRGFPFRRFSNGLTRAIAVAAVISALVGVSAIPESSAAASTIIVSASDCARLVRHRPSSDVAYRPGVDANGNAVAPADLPADLPGAVAVKTPTEITFEVTYDLLSAYGVSETGALVAQGDATVGTVEYDLLSGALTFNGERLDDAEADALGALCQEAEGG